MTDKALDELTTKACNPRISLSDLRRVALGAIGELKALRTEHARYREESVRPKQGGYLIDRVKQSAMRKLA